ncbi:MAG: MgtC/SapB family protein [Sphingobacteriales bacterium]|jgi:putative Mg2+ transporter-C (MgtC) family protein|nr:MgtC/SapB family protein [Sphingobacteriales bacterium]MBP9141221.1 MgtC/SapB family protein [Chitinophagales bacterium]MDA0199268.1 MgtC/SapB family protein [Bacteroidota bacterium]MBK6890444.1 MgtC/SapB family protein [Sphingobacteriales bacterium]MBK7526504.1 MgtC/SapB family protein [Sphingobacteriales bacterium]
MDLTLNWPDIAKLLIAVFVGAVIGSEREYHNKSAGFRTIILICFAACLFTILSLKIGSSSPDRIAANIVTGIGFLGAGAIFKEENRISGLTTAAIIWASAALGMCIGANYISLALIGFLVVVAVLFILNKLEQVIDLENETHRYTIATRAGSDLLFEYKALFEKNSLIVIKWEVAKKGGLLIGKAQVSGRHAHHDVFIRAALDDARIEEFVF